MRDNKPVKILVDCHVFDGSFQGTTTYIKGVYTELIKNQKFNFFFAGENIEILKSIFGEQNNVSYIKYKSKNKFYRLLIDLPTIIRRNNIQYAHFQYVVPPVKYCKYITTLHDILFLDFPEYFPLTYRLKNKLLFSLSAKKTDVLLTVSDYSKKRIKKLFDKNCLITPNAVDPVFYEDFNKEAIIKKVFELYGIKNYFLYVSRWEPRKNHDMLLKVFVKNSYYKNYHLVFVGDDAIPNKKYEALYAQLPENVRKKIILLNKVSFSKMVMLVRGASLSVYPSVAEGFGIPPLEAAAAGTPVVCSGTTAMSDFNFFENCLFDPYSEDDLVEKIEIALNSLPNENLKDIIRKKYRWKDAASVISEALDKDVV